MAMIIIKDEMIEKIRKEKDCKDFLPWRDGTLSGDERYCGHSLICQQMHPSEAGILIGCISHHEYMNDPHDPGSLIFAPFCTGCLPKHERDDSKGEFQKDRILRAGDT